MKRLLKNFTLVLLTCALALCLPLMAFGDESTYKITINGTALFNSEESKYNVFQIASIGSDDTVAVNDSYRDFKYTENEQDYSYSNLATYILDIENNASSLLNLSVALANYIQAIEIQPSDTVSLTGKTASQTKELQPGYYLVVKEVDGVIDLTSSLCTLVKLTDNQEITPKTNTPSIDKFIMEGGKEVKGIFADDRSEITFLIKTIVPDMSAYEAGSYVFKVYDTYTNGLTPKTKESENGKDVIDLTVKIGVESYTAYSVDKTTEVDGNSGFIITFTPEKFQKLDAGTPISIEYKATVSTEEYVDISGTPQALNKVYLEYSNNPNSSETGTTPEREVHIYSMTIDVIKESSPDGNKLAGAKFQLFKKQEVNGETKTFYYTFSNNESGWSDDPKQAFTATTGADGSLDNPFKGLSKDENYYLKETAAPEHYAISNTYSEGALVASVLDVNESGLLSNFGFVEKVVVTNQLIPPGLLPSTGGMGTVIFYVVGGILVLGAGITLVVRRRVNSRR